MPITRVCLELRDVVSSVAADRSAAPFKSCTSCAATASARPRVTVESLSAGSKSRSDGRATDPGTSGLDELFFDSFRYLSQSSAQFRGMCEGIDAGDEPEAGEDKELSRYAMIEWE